MHLFSFLRFTWKFQYSIFGSFELLIVCLFVQFLACLFHISILPTFRCFLYIFVRYFIFSEIFDDSYFCIIYFPFLLFLTPRGPWFLDLLNSVLLHLFLLLSSLALQYICYFTSFFFSFFYPRLFSVIFSPYSTFSLNPASNILDFHYVFSLFSFFFFCNFFFFLAFHFFIYSFLPIISLYSWHFSHYQNTILTEFPMKLIILSVLNSSII